jgi:NADH-quinone oxidoreductase subunit I
MVEGLEERDYYQGKVAKATPAQRDWAAAHADEDEPGADQAGHATALSEEGGVTR